MTAKNEVSTRDHKLLRELKNAASTQVCNSHKEGLKMVSHFEDEDTVHRYVPFLVSMVCWTKKK